MGRMGGCDRFQTTCITAFLDLSRFSGNVLGGVFFFQVGRKKAHQSLNLKNQSCTKCQDFHK